MGNIALPTGSVIISYNVRDFPFHRFLAQDVYRVPQLNRLHVYWKKQTKRDEVGYVDNLYLRKLMQDLPDTSLFYTLYHAWVAKVLAPIYNNKISYSMHPKMRVHLAGTGCVSDYHRDVDVTGRHDQINVYLPFTDVFDGSTLWCQEDYDLEHYIALNLKYGQALLWDGGYLRHGTVTNNTNNTRVSCDFRFAILNNEIVRSPYSNILAKR